MRYSPYSYSKIETYKKCPKLFEFSYLKEKVFEIIPTEFQVGAALHKVAELIQKGTEFDLNKIANKYIDNDVQNEIKEKGKEIMDWFKQPDLSKYKMFLTEYKIAMSSDFKKFDINYWGDDVFFRGVIDRAEIMNDNILKVIDLKYWKKTEIEISEQLYLYAYCLWNKVKNSFPWISNSIILEIWNINYHGKKTPKTVDISEIVSTSVKYLNENIIKIENDTDFKPKIGDHCVYCNFKSYCNEFIKAEGDTKLVTEYLIRKNEFSLMEKRLKSYVRENGNISIDGKMFGVYNSSRVSYDGSDVFEFIRHTAGMDYLAEMFHMNKTEMTKFIKKYKIESETIEQFATEKKINNFGFSTEGDDE